MTHPAKGLIPAIDRRQRRMTHPKMTVQHKSEVKKMINFNFKCPKCGSVCFGTSNANDPTIATISCHSLDDPDIQRKKQTGLLPKDFICHYVARYLDNSHWVKV